MKLIQQQALTDSFPLALVVSRFNHAITQGLYDGAIQRLQELEFTDSQLTVVWVPGAIEIPITLQRLAKTGRYEALIALGAVIRGETTHYDYVCQQVSDGTQRIALQYDLPVIFSLLTTETAQQARDRIGGSHGHKGREAIDTAMAMVSVLRQLD